MKSKVPTLEAILKYLHPKVSTYEPSESGRIFMLTPLATA